MPPKKTALGAFKTYFNFREKQENHSAQLVRGVPVDQRVWSDAPVKSAIGGLVFDRVGLTTKDFSDKYKTQQ